MTSCSADKPPFDLANRFPASPNPLALPPQLSHRSSRSSTALASSRPRTGAFLQAWCGCSLHAPTGLARSHWCSACPTAWLHQEVHDPRRMPRWRDDRRSSAPPRAADRGSVGRLRITAAPASAMAVPSTVCKRLASQLGAVTAAMNSAHQVAHQLSGCMAPGQRPHGTDRTRTGPGPSAGTRSANVCGRLHRCPQNVRRSSMRSSAPMGPLPATRSPSSTS
jgi:hypothetical protein